MATAKKKAAPAKKGGFLEKATGERYASRAAMRKHEKSEGAAERKKEYGGKRGR